MPILSWKLNRVNTSNADLLHTPLWFPSTYSLEESTIHKKLSRLQMLKRTNVVKGYCSIGTPGFRFGGSDAATNVGASDVEFETGQASYDAVPSISMYMRCFMKATKVTTMRSMIPIPAGRISRNARLERETIPILARRYRARGVKLLSAKNSCKIQVLKYCMPGLYGAHTHGH